jgi:hypothetical protein
MREPWQPILSQSKRGPGLLALDWAQGARGARLFLASDATQPASEFAELRARSSLRTVSLPGCPPTGLVFAQAVCARTGGRLARAWSDGTVDVLRPNQLARATGSGRCRVDVLGASALATRRADAVAGGAPQCVCVLTATAPPSAAAARAASGACAGCGRGLLALRSACWSPNARSEGFLARGGKCAVVRCLEPSRQTGQLRSVKVRARQHGTSEGGGRARGRPRESGGGAAKRRRAADEEDEDELRADDADSRSEEDEASGGGSDSEPEPSEPGASDPPE